MRRFWDRLDERMQENASGILGTVAFHMVLIVIFLVLKISAEKTRLENIIMVDFNEEYTEKLLEKETPDPEFEERLARYLDESRSNVPVNLARKIDQEISTEEYVRELEEDLDASRPEEWQEIQDRLKEQEELEQEEISLEAEKDLNQQQAEAYEGPTNIFYDLRDRYHLRLYVPVYKCEGSGMVEVQIAVDQRGRVLQAETEKPGENANEICLAEAARNAAMKTRFNADYNAPERQTGKIIYHFISQ